MGKWKRSVDQKVWGGLRNAEDELAAHVAALDALVRVGGALEREDLLDVRLQPAVVDELGELAQVDAVGRTNT